MMTGTHSLYNHLNFKHEKWLNGYKQLIGDDIFKQFIDAILYPVFFIYLEIAHLLGIFSLPIDMNYSPVIDFDENSYVKAGIGAIRGIKML